ncbi:hypothetical protein MM239_01880 [Belliella sp. DSM 111904]|uniref:Uncharacterized protein n=1 Tax=Belliella filtrata TaxID=2923435 RepID=A0ABS9UWI6_9BACT|nr:hypothetical protein [Belliella filtrata]MCH7408130.1 hypothetical protein [Belliella filtrata]
MKTPSYHSMLISRYSACKFNFNSFENEQFTYSIYGYSFSFSNEYVSFRVKEDKEVLKSISLEDIFELSQKYPDFHLDFDFLINPVPKLSYNWRNSFVSFLREKEKEMGFEVACSLRRLVAASPKLKDVNAIYGLELYQALYIICESGTDSLQTISGACYEEALQFLNKHEIYLKGQENPTNIWTKD